MYHSWCLAFSLRPQYSVDRGAVCRIADVSKKRYRPAGSFLPSPAALMTLYRLYSARMRASLISGVVSGRSETMRAARMS